MTVWTTGCFTTDDLYLFQGGLGLRFGNDRPGSVVPFAKAGLTYESERGSDDRWLPGVLGGVEWIVLRNFAVRLGVESERQFSARIASGVTTLLR